MKARSRTEQEIEITTSPRLRRYLLLLSRFWPLPLKDDLTEPPTGRRPYRTLRAALKGGSYQNWETGPEARTLATMMMIGKELLKEGEVTPNVVIKAIGKHGLAVIYHPLAFPAVFEIAQSMFWQKSDHDPRALHSRVVSIIRAMRSQSDDLRTQDHLDRLTLNAIDRFQASTWRKGRSKLVSRRRARKITDKTFQWNMRRENRTLLQSLQIDGVDNRLWLVLSRSLELRTRDYSCRTKQIVCSIVHAWTSSGDGGGPTVKEIGESWDRVRRHLRPSAESPGHSSGHGHRCSHSSSSSQFGILSGGPPNARSSSDPPGGPSGELDSPRCPRNRSSRPARGGQGTGEAPARNPRSPRSPS